MSALDDLDGVIEQYHEAADQFSRGDPEPIKALYSHRDDVTLANPFGPAVRGVDAGRGEAGLCLIAIQGWRGH